MQLKKIVLKTLKVFSFLILILVISGLLFMNQKSFGKLPSGERLARIEQSPNYKNGSFKNLTSTTNISSDKSKFQIFYEFFVDKVKDLRPTKDLPSVKTNLKELDSTKNYAVWMGHSSLYFQIDQQKILVDPVLISASPISLFNKAFKGTSVYQPSDIPDLDFLILTHDHWDHLDYETVKLLKNRVKKIILPLGVGAHFEHWGFDKNQLIELDWYDEVILNKDLKITVLPARHFSGRGLTANKSLWASYMLQTKIGNLFLSGDSGYGEHFKSIKKMFPTIDYAFLENGQYNKDWQDIHMLPEDLVEVIKELEPKKLFTIHNSKFALAKHPWFEPMDNIYKASKENNFPLLTPKIGELIELDNPNQTFNVWWKKHE